MSELDRWETTDLDLDELLNTGTSAQQRAAVAAAAIVAAQRTGLDEDPVPEAVSSLRENRVDSALRAQLAALADRIDDEAFAKHDEVDEGRAEYAEYQRLFRRARAATALATAMEDDAKTAAADGIYEAYHALDTDGTAIDDAIRSAVEPPRD